MTQASAVPLPISQPRPRTRRLDLSSLGALFWLTVRQQCRARRLIVLAFLFTLPAALALVARYFNQSITGSHLEITTIFALALVAYCSLFGLLSLMVRRSLIVGAAYIVLFEGLLANIPFVARSLTIMYFLRVLILRWTEQPVKDWAINLSEAPAAW